MTHDLQPTSGALITNNPLNPGKLTFAQRRALQADGNQITRQFLTQNLRIKAQSMLAHSAMNETADLAMKAQNYSQLYPEAEAHFRYILDQFAFGAVDKIRTM